MSDMIERIYALVLLAAPLALPALPLAAVPLWAAAAILPRRRSSSSS